MTYHAPHRHRGAAPLRIIRGAGGDSGGAESPNTLRSRATLRVIDLLGEGEVVGLVDGAKSIFFDDTPLMNEEGEYNFEGVKWYFRAGLPDQASIPGFNGVESEQSVGVEVKHGIPITRTLNDPDFDAVVATLRFPSMSITDDSGNIKPSQVKIRISVRHAGGTFDTTTGDLVIYGKCTSPYDKEFYFTLPKNPSGPSSPWEVKVERLSKDAESSKIQNSVYLSSLKGVIEEKFTYPYTAHIGVEIDAKQFGGNIPQRAYELYGRKILVPSNYNPVTRVYTGLWDGTFVEAWTDNPAWVFYDVLVQDRFGLGEYIDATQIDKWSLYEIAQYCDGQVPDGFGGLEPRFTFNGVIQTRTEAFEAIATIASSFRGMGFWSSGSIIATQDSPKDPVILAHPSNVIDGLFNYESSALKARHTVALVKWNDPNDLYRPAIEVVQDEDGIRRYGYRETTITATGCTSRGMANRIGRWTLLTELRETRAVSYQAGLDHAAVRPGDIVAIQDPTRANNDFGGRLRSGCSDVALLLDHPVKFTAGNTYTVSVPMPDGSVAERGVTVPVYEQDVTSVALSSPLPEAPAEDTMWVISSSSLTPALFRVLSNKESKPNIFDIYALQYEPTKFSAVDEGTEFAPLLTTGYPVGALRPPTNLTASEYVYQIGGSGAVAAVTLGVTAPDDVRVSQFEWQYQSYDIDGEALGWTQIGYSTEPSIDVEIGDGLFDFRVRSVSAAGNTSSWLTRAASSLSGLTTPPADVDSFGIAVLGSQATLSWSTPDTTNISHYEIRYSPAVSGASWSSATILVERAGAPSVQVPTLSGTFLIKAASSKGVYSRNAAIVTSSVSDILRLNAVENLVEEPAFSGAKQSVVAISGVLSLDGEQVMSDWVALSDVSTMYPGSSGVVAEGTYTFAERVDLGAVYTSRVTALMQAYGRDFRDSIAMWANLAAVDVIVNTESDKWEARLSYRVTDDDPGASPVWSEWTELVAGDIKFRAIEFSVILRSFDPQVTPAVSLLQVSVDMPDRSVAMDNLAVPAAGRRIEFSPPFKKLLGLGIADQDLQTGDIKTITDKDETGFFIRYYDETGTPVARTFDFNALGYGVIQ